MIECLQMFFYESSTDHDNNNENFPNIIIGDNMNE